VQNPIDVEIDGDLCRDGPDAGAHSCGNHTNPKVATFCAVLWLTFTLPLTANQLAPLASPATEDEHHVQSGKIPTHAMDYKGSFQLASGSNS